MPRSSAATSMRLLLALLVGLALGCAPKLKTGSALRMKDRLDPDCVASTLRSLDGVHDVVGQDPTRFRLTPQGQRESYAFELRQVEVGLGDAWVLEISGEQSMPQSNEARFEVDLDELLVQIQNEIGTACHAVVIDSRP